MATVDVVSFGLQDEAGNSKSVPVYVPSGSTVAYIQAFVTALATILADVTDAAVVSAQVTLALTIPGGLPAAGTQHVQEGALLSFNAANTPYNHGVFIPGWKDSLFAGNVIGSDSAITAIIDGLTEGLGTAGHELFPSDRYANDLTAILSGKRRFRK